MSVVDHADMPAMQESSRQLREMAQKSQLMTNALLKIIEVAGDGTPCAHIAARALQGKQW